MTLINKETGTRIDEIADGLYRISTPIPAGPALPTGFSFNQYLIADDAPLLYHSGPRGMFDLTSAAINAVMPASKLRYVAFSHVESDECGALNKFLAIAPEAEPLCSDVAAMVSMNDLADRPARGLADGERVSLGKKTVRWISTPHLPHAWECGHLFEEATETLFCGDLFTQGGDSNPPVEQGDILDKSEAFRAPLDYFSHTRNCKALISKIASTKPRLLACMHGSAWRGDGGALLRELGDRLDG